MRRIPMRYYGVCLEASANILQHSILHYITNVCILKIDFTTLLYVCWCSLTSWT
ncbi:unnamed protein product [Arabidopsis halleri]